MEGIDYKGYTIRSTSIQIADSNKWTVAVNIVTPQGDNNLDQPFSSAMTFASQEEADNHSIDFGKQIIDGKHINIYLAEPY